MDAFNLPFQLGDTYWQALGTPYQVEVPCPVCFGKLAVTIILGNGERIGVPCEACQKGYDIPRGVIHEWEHQPRAVKFTIASVESMYNGRWSLKSTTGGRADFHELFTTYDAALAKAIELAKQQHESNMNSRQRHRNNTKDHTWSVRYHRAQIKDLERQMAWHQGKLKENT
jgi:hypothetical protein